MRRSTAAVSIFRLMRTTLTSSSMARVSAAIRLATAVAASTTLPTILRYPFRTRAKSLSTRRSTTAAASAPIKTSPSSETARPPARSTRTRPWKRPVQRATAAASGSRTKSVSAALRSQTTARATPAAASTAITARTMPLLSAALSPSPTTGRARARKAAPRATFS